MESFDIIAPNATVSALTSEQIKKYLDSLVQNKELYDHARLREAMAGFVFPVNVMHSSARIVRYCADPFELFYLISYGEFRSENSKHMIKIFLSRVRSPALKTVMGSALRFWMDRKNL